MVFHGLKTIFPEKRVRWETTHFQQDKFKEAWIECETEKEAKTLAVLFNGKQVGGRRHTEYWDAVWHVRYVPGLRWETIFADQVARENERQAKVELAMRRAKAVANELHDRTAAAFRARHARARRAAKPRKNAGKS